MLCTNTVVFLPFLKMNEINHKIRIKDIANLAGVSEGTVDRVLHHRGDVSAKSLEAVTKVLDEINYKPNLLARSLASKKTISLCLSFSRTSNFGLLGKYKQRF